MNTSIETIKIELAGMKDTFDLAQRLARLAKIGDVIALSGDLGAGKTEFARAFIRQLTDPDEEVPSPTFTLVQTYDGQSGEIWHLDLYRINTPEEVLELGIEEVLGSVITIVEWPEKMGQYLPRGRLDIFLTVTKGKNHRQAELIAHGNWAERLRESGHA
ncbi:MAG: tRNA (adenosine(37)-N6)-threonylcarbamoyltransferase complex ATPase subunit type 1 TsaE [Rhodospirillaceae bacterium]|nr:tRNA (adenosine(37)-N6)-threonylcarbamoyltransferase complex ATPase subunit type 1 TsaE [Rhodospirillaceae bacterium]MDH5189382.1 tRNA (adenosine(37)-N6)-threonylcarbamoyltransferase complex ATPase subunit type 1 TsaE [Rhodospirillaceae bacterium]